MSRSAARFTESDVRRVLTASAKARVNVRIRIEPNGAIVIDTGVNPGEPQSESSSWDAAVAALEEDR
jgi:hypothetical protein